ncbi:hypothetical protein MUK42_20536, partial [Musa troglodytarum]
PSSTLRPPPAGLWTGTCQWKSFKEWLKRLDADKDGRISRDELRRATRCIHTGGSAAGRALAGSATLMLMATPSSTSWRSLLTSAWAARSSPTRCARQQVEYVNVTLRVLQTKRSASSVCKLYMFACCWESINTSIILIRFSFYAFLQRVRLPQDQTHEEST